MGNSLVSIITPCYNMAHCVFRLFDSIIDQDYRPLEFILVDDGSTDNIAELVEEYRALFEENNISFVYFHQENKGLGGAINAGLKLVNGEFLCWPDADDYLEPTSISERVEFLENHLQYASVTSNAYVRQSDDLKNKELMIKSNFAVHEDEQQFEKHLNGDSIFCSGCHMVRSSCFRDVNPNMEIFPARRGQNWQLLLPLYYKYKRGFLNRPLYNYLVFPNSMSKGDDTEEKILFRYREHRTILIKTLEQIETVQCVNLHDYYSFIEDKYAKLEMETAIKYKDRKHFKELLSSKQRMVGLDSWDRLAEIRSKMPFFNKCISNTYRLLKGSWPGTYAEKLLHKLKNGGV